MNFIPQNKIDAGFSLASVTNLVFLLLVFFILTSSFVTASGLVIDLPVGQEGRIEIQKVSVTITKDLQYFINDKKVSRGTLEGELKSRLTGNGGSVVLYVDKAVPAEQLVEVASMAARLEAKVVIATKLK